MINPAMTPKEFAREYLIYDEDIMTLDDLREYMENHPDDDHWYFDIGEYDEADTEGVVLVQDPISREALWVEVDVTENW